MAFVSSVVLEDTLINENNTTVVRVSTECSDISIHSTFDYLFRRLAFNLFQVPVSVICEGGTYLLDNSIQFLMWRADNNSKHKFINSTRDDIIILVQELNPQIIWQIHIRHLFLFNVTIQLIEWSKSVCGVGVGVQCVHILGMNMCTCLCMCVYRCMCLFYLSVYF